MTASLVLLLQPELDDFISGVHSELVQVEDVLAAVGEGLEEVLLLPRLAAVLLLLLEGDDDLAVLGQRAGQPGPAVLVFVNIEDLEVVEEYQDGVSDGGQVEDLLEVSLEGDQVVGDVIVRHVQVVADLLTDGEQEWLEGGTIR